MYDYKLLGKFRDIRISLEYKKIFRVLKFMRGSILQLLKWFFLEFGNSGYLVNVNGIKFILEFFKEVSKKEEFQMLRLC